MKKLWFCCVLSFMIIFASVWISGSRNNYVRYTSSPFKDGTRYTFVHPDGMKVINSSEDYLTLRFVPSLSPLEKLQGYLRVGSQLKFLGDMSFHQIDVQVSMQNKPFKSSKSITPPYLFLDDAHSRKNFFVKDEYWGTERTKRDEQSETILNSFQVLSPKDPVPSP